MKKQKIKHGLVIVNTGNGKGKSTSAFGMVLRSWGRGFQVCVVQFIKAETGQWGEVKAAKKLGINWFAIGDGFTWTSKDMDETVARALQGWEVAKEKISSRNYDLIVLDEFTYALHFGWLDTKQVIDWLKANKPEDMHLVITGRDAPAELIEYADLVTEMMEVKHPFQKGIQAQAGIEY
ncbi:MAG: cob(I)yrinic acid a,c-diamide adenosyltransferase [Chloroflexi bacterium]|nr:cob(I)yrinic acid a,c-diamide adenosyltransferase [Chloroflexota bacterium]